MKTPMKDVCGAFSSSLVAGAFKAAVGSTAASLATQYRYASSSSRGSTWGRGTKPKQGLLSRLQGLYHDFQLRKDRQLDIMAAEEARQGFAPFGDTHDAVPSTCTGAVSAAKGDGALSGNASSLLIRCNSTFCPRSVLFVPGSKPRALSKIPSLAADCFIIDLEDSVGVASKRQARENILAFVEELRKVRTTRGPDHAGATPSTPHNATGEMTRAAMWKLVENAEEGKGQAAAATADACPRLIVRINSPDDDPATAMLDLQLVSLLGPAIEGVAIPKVTVHTYELIRSYVHPEHQLWAFFESPRSVIEAPSICAQQVYRYAVMGYNDLSAELQLPMTPPPPSTTSAGPLNTVSEAVKESLHITARLPLWQSTIQVLQAARAHHMFVLDAVFNDPTDKRGFSRSLQECRLLGLNGKTLIHPDQIEPTNAAYTPSGEEVVWAQRIIDAVRGAEGGVATVDGKMVEELHQRQAERVLALHRSSEQEKYLKASVLNSDVDASHRDGPQVGHPRPPLSRHRPATELDSK